MIVDRIRAAAVREGFAWMGVTQAVTPEGTSRLMDWIDAGYAAGMTYFEQRREAYKHPSSVLPGVRSIIALADEIEAGLSSQAPQAANMSAKIRKRMILLFKCFIFISSKIMFRDFNLLN